MKKKRRGAAAKKPSAADFLVSPPQGDANTTTNRASESPKSFEFNLDTPVNISGGGSGGNSRNSIIKEENSPHVRRTEALTSIAELKELTASRMNLLKKKVERSHSDMFKEVESSHSRLHRRIKIQTQACQHFLDETEKEFKKMSEKITETCEAMKVSYTEFKLEAKTTGSRARSRRTSISEKEQSFEERFNALRSRYKILSTAD